MLQLSYGLGALPSSPAIGDLQRSLIGLAQASGNPTINPGAADGIVGMKTITAVVSAMSLLTRHLGQIGGVIQAGLGIYSIADQARAGQIIAQYAPQLNDAAKKATLAIATGQQSPGMTPAIPTPAPGMIPGMVGTPWYKTWWGIGAIGVGVVGLLAILLVPPRRAAPAPAPTRAAA